MADLSNIYDVYQFMNDKNIIFAYSGTFDHFVTTSLLKNIKKTLIGAETLQKKIYNIIVECIENMSKHSNHEHENQNNGFLLLCQSETKYIVITGNYIFNEEIPELKEKLDKVANLKSDELKKMYREQILSKRTHENSAGLGIIDIAIKSENQIKFDFKPYTERTSFYLFQTEITINL